MKKTLLYNFLPILVAMLMGVTFTACDDDDDEGTNLSTPAYEAISAKYTITDSEATINSLELTASGNYIIVKKQNSYRSPAKRTIAQNVFMRNQLVTRATSYDNIIYGKFTQKSENEYELEGYGIVKITAANNELYTLDITLDNGNVINVGARKQQIYESSEATNNLCRTWNISKIGFKAEISGHTFDKMVDENKLDELFTDFVKWAVEQAGYSSSDIPADYLEKAVAEYVDEYNESKPLSVIFTKSGSYMVHYNNGMLGVSTWTWEKESEGIFRYSWNTNDINDSNLSGTCKVSYSGNTLLIAETAEENGTKITVTYGMEELK